MNPIIRKTVLSSLVAASLALAGAAVADDRSKIERDANERQNGDRTAGQAIDDAAITASIKAKLLEDQRTEGFDVNVDTVNGRVTLRGGADTAADRATAGKIARETDGVRSVDNRIVVAASGTEARQDANQATASGEVREAFDEAGDELSDGWITSKIKSALVADDDVSGLDIRVETEDKVVRLAGDVPSAAARAEAVRIAQSTDGVARVDASGLKVRETLRSKR